MSWTSRVKQIDIGDTVAYSASFLRSTGQQTGPMPFARGIVTELKPLGQTIIATVDWNDDDIPPRVNLANLSRVTEKGIHDRS